MEFTLAKRLPSLNCCGLVVKKRKGEIHMLSYEREWLGMVVEPDDTHLGTNAVAARLLGFSIVLSGPSRTSALARPTRSFRRHWIAAMS